MRPGMCALTIVTGLVLAPATLVAQVPGPRAKVDLDRRVFVDANQVVPSEVIDQLATAVGCRLEVDPRLPVTDISLRLSNVRARTALDAVCDMVGCRWRLDGRTLRVATTSPPPPIPPAQAYLERMRRELVGERWKLERRPAAEVLHWLADETGEEIVFEGFDTSVPLTADLRGRTVADALRTVWEAVVGPWVSPSGTFHALKFHVEVSQTGHRRVTRLRAAESVEAALKGRFSASVRVYEKGDPGVTMPMVLSRVNAKHTPATLQAKIQGMVHLSCIVGSDGSVGNITVVKSLEPSLDDAAIEAVRQWRFAPGTKDGKPVGVRIDLEFSFTLH